MKCHFFKNGFSKRFLADNFCQETFGGEAGVAEKPDPKGNVQRILFNALALERSWKTLVFCLKIGYDVKLTGKTFND
jgi:hypothetical protein